MLSFEDYRNAETPNETARATPTRAATQELSPHADDGLVRPTFKERPPARSGRSTDPDGVIRPTFTGRVAAPAGARDPDGVIRPTFVARPRWSVVAVDPDGLIAPTFASPRRFAAIGDADADDLIDPAPTRTTVRSVVPAGW